MRATEEQKAHVTQWIEKWRPRLFLQHHRITPLFRTKSCKDDEPERMFYAHCTYGDAGLDAQIDFYPAFFRNPVERQERILCHELLHIVLPSATESEINLMTEILWQAYP